MRILIFPFYNMKLSLAPLRTPRQMCELAPAIDLIVEQGVLDLPF